MKKHWFLYILKLEQGKWYVGITSQSPEKRFKQHQNGFLAASWTKRYKPLTIHDTKDLGICEIEQAQTYEGRVTREYMKKYGDNNVRGGDLTDVGDYIRLMNRIFLKEQLYLGLYALGASLLIFYYAVKDLVASLQ